MLKGILQEINIYQLQEIITKGLEATPDKYDNISVWVLDKFIYLADENDKALILMKVL